MKVFQCCAVLNEVVILPHSIINKVIRVPVESDGLIGVFMSFVLLIQFPLSYWKKKLHRWNLM